MGEGPPYTELGKTQSDSSHGVTQTLDNVHRIRWCFQCLGHKQFLWTEKSVERRRMMVVSVVQRIAVYRSPSAPTAGRT